MSPQQLRERELMSVTANVMLEVTDEARLSPNGSADELVKSLNRIEGVQSVRFQRQDFEGN